MIVILKRQDRVNYIISKTVIHYELSEDKLLGYVRKDYQLERKHFIIKLLREIADISFKEIAWRCNTSESPVHVQLTRLNEDLRYDKELQQRYNELENRILTNT